MGKNTHPKLDEKWFVRLRQVCSLPDEAEWLQQYSRISNEEKELFLSNETENPKFSFKQMPSDNSAVDDIEAMIADLEAEEKDVIILDLYRQKLERQLIRNQVIRASLHSDDVAFYRESANLYGKPKKKYFVYVAKRVTELADARAAAHPVVAKRLKKIMSKIDTKGVTISADILPPPVLDGEPITSSEQVVKIFSATLDRLAITGWQVIVDTKTPRSRFAVNPFQKIVYVPKIEYLLDRGEKLTTVHVEALAEHEIGVHVRRGFAGAGSRLSLLQIGLDSYLLGEEGLASYTQQQIEGTTEFYGFDRYLAASLAIGMDGITRDFRTVFGIMLDYYTLYFDTTSISAVQKAAWNVCVRVFRGTTGQTAGTIFTKDTVYLEGNIEMWHLISDAPDCFESLFVGKYNPLLPRHIKSLQTLEILT